MQGKKLITDEGFVEKKDRMGQVVMAICIVVSLSLVVLGILAYLA